MNGILDLLRMQQGFQPNGRGVLGLLNFPQSGYGTPPIAPTQPNAGDGATPSFLPTTYGGGPRFSPWGAPAEQAPRPQPPAAPAQRQTAGPDLRRVVPPTTAPMAPMPSPAAPALTAMRDAPPTPNGPRTGIAGFLDRANAPIAEGGDVTPLDGLSLGLQLMGAGEASWNVDQPSGWTRAGGAIGETMANAQERGFRNEQRDAFRAEQQRASETHAHEQEGWQRERDQIAAAMAEIQAMPDGPEKEWAMAYPMEYARIRLAEHAQAGTQEAADGFLWTRGANGELVRGEEIPLNAAQRAEIAVQRARIAADSGMGGIRPLTPNQYNEARNLYGGIQQTRSQLGRVQDLMGRLTDAQLMTQLGDANSGFMSALTQLQLSLKEQAELGALAGPDLALLRSFTGDPRDTVAFLRGGGARGMRQQLAEVERGLGLSETRWADSLRPHAARPELADLYAQIDQRRNARDEVPTTEQFGSGNRTPTATDISVLMENRDDPVVISGFAARFGADALQRALRDTAPGASPVVQGRGGASRPLY